MEREQIRDRLANGRAELEQRGNASESDTRSLLIDPLLDHLGYTAEFRRSEHQNRGNRPDEIIYAQPASKVASRSSAAIILEAKTFGTDLEKSTQGRVGAPKRQIKRYLRDHSAAGEVTRGVLTDGAKWYVLRRTGFGGDVEHVKEIDIFAGDMGSNLGDLRELLSREKLAALSRPVKRSKTRESVLQVLSAVSRGEPPAEIVGLLVKSKQARPAIQDTIELSGRAADAERNDWAATDWDLGCPVAGGTKSSPGAVSGRSVIAAVQFNVDPGGERLARQDIDLAARAFSKLDDSRVCVLIAYLNDEKNQETAVRVAVHVAGSTAMTAELDADLVPDRVLDSLAELKKLLGYSSPRTASSLASTVAVKKIREEFYKAVAKWAKDKQDSLPKDSKDGEAVLRHLIRVVFAWILKENKLCNPDIFEEWFANRYEDSYHQDVISFMFNHRFNRVETERKEASSSEIDTAMEDIPFLNGSIFAEREEDTRLDVSKDEYFSTDNTSPGLFTVLSRYDWSMSEHTVSVNEQTIDGEMLSHLFENLAVTALSDSPAPKKMEKGTYYTPPDVATEMAKDALSAAVRARMPESLPEEALLGLFGDPHFEMPEMPEQDKDSLRKTIRSLSVLDPAVGSGAFLLVTANTIATALRNLGDTEKDMFRSIAQTQLYGLDITSMAVQIARLRISIAIMSDERSSEKLNALPNLEARIICADTLATIADPEWRPDSTGQLVDIDTGIQKALADVSNTQEEWLEAHTEKQKANIQTKDRQARDTLKAKLEEANWDRKLYPEIWNFAEHKIFDTDAGISKADARLVFYRQGLEGFDIVIGNPPYVKAAKPQKKELAKKSYITGEGGDLYNYFCETALTLAKPQGGVVCVIVPLSVSFDKTQTATRQMFEAKCSEIWLRHQDNRPDQTFGKSPVRNPENLQRTTIITAVAGENKAKIWTSGTARWLSSEREAYFRNRNPVQIPDAFIGFCAKNLTDRLSCQWPRLASDNICEIVVEMLQQKRTIKDLAAGASSFKVAFPATAGYFISCIPDIGMQRSESMYSLTDQQSCWVAMTAFNSHLFYMWWRVWGDAFHLTKYQIEGMPIPDMWIDNSDINTEARYIGKKLAKTLNNPDHIIRTQKGNVFENINFHAVAPELIEQADRLYLKALKIESAEADLMLNELRKLRSESNWRR